MQRTKPHYDPNANYASDDSLVEHNLDVVRRRVELGLKLNRHTVETTDETLKVVKATHALLGAQVGQVAAQPSATAVGPDVLGPLTLGTYIPREGLQRAIEGRLVSQEGSPALIAFHGMGGVGKTTLALHTIHSDSIRQRYQERRYWFHDSDDSDRLETQFHQLAVNLKLIEPNAVRKKAVASVLAYFNALDKRYFIVFDNADTPESLKPYLPDGGGEILVTTRNLTWPDRVEVEVLALDQSLALIRKFLGEDPNASELAEAMGHHPLGLTQACAYIKADPYLSSAEFLQFLKEHSGTILESHPELQSKPLPKSVASLWSITLDKLDNESSALLTQLAYIAPDKIPLPLAGIMGTQEACETLLKYALIQKRDDHTLYIHRLLQMVVRLRDSDQSTTLQKACEALTASFIHDPRHHVERVVNWSLLPHGEALLTASCGLTSPSTELLKSLAPSLKVIGHILRDRGDTAGAKEKFERALAIAEAVYGPEHPQVAICLNYLGNALRDLGDAVGAKERYERALAITERVYGPDHAEVANCLNNLGNALRNIGDTAGAKERFERALAIDEQVYGPEHHQVAFCLSNLGNSLSSLGDVAGAKERYERALAIDERVYGPEHPRVAIRLVNLGKALRLLGDAVGAKESYERALAIHEQVYGPEHPQVAICLINLGTALRDLGDAAGAKKRYERALAIEEQVYGPDHPHVASCLNNLGNALKDLGAVTGANKMYERAYSIAFNHASMGPDHPHTKLFKRNLDQATNPQCTIS